MKLFSFLFFVIMIFFSEQNFAMADNHPNHAKQNDLRVKNSQQAAQLAKGRVGGKVLKVSKSSSNGNLAYRVKIVKADGHVVSILVDAKTGQLSGN